MGNQIIMEFSLHEIQSVEIMFIFSRPQNLVHDKLGKLHICI
jgi:hypothetical protein